MSEAIPLPAHPGLAHYEALARDLDRAAAAGTVEVWAARWMDQLARELDPVTRSGFPGIGSEAGRITRRWQEARDCGPREFVAREHGFATWEEFAEHVQALSQPGSAVAIFEAAAAAVVHGDAGTLRELLQRRPELVRMRSLRQHHSTLLHYVSANGVEDFRQKTPANIAAIAAMLLDAGAAIDAESDAYGGGSTVLGLVATSLHPQQAGVQMALLQALLDRGAVPDPPHPGGNTRSIVHSCLANGQPEAAAFLAGRGARLDMIGAAGLGWLDLVRRHFVETSPERHAAFEYACWYGQTAVVAFLLDSGIEPSWPNADGETGLHRAAYGAHLDLAALLLDRGARVDVRDDAYGATPLDTALWIWRNTKDAVRRERCYAMVATLARAGATLDPRQWHDPAATGPGMIEAIAAAPRMEAALRGELL